jgi:hypothetical protein
VVFVLAMCRIAGSYGMESVDEADFWAVDGSVLALGGIHLMRERRDGWVLRERLVHAKLRSDLNFLP